MSTEEQFTELIKAKLLKLKVGVSNPDQTASEIAELAKVYSEYFFNIDEEV